VTEKPEPINPYEPPRLQPSENEARFVDPELDRLVRRSDVIFDLMVVATCLVFPLIFYMIGADLAHRGAAFGGSFVRAGPVAIYWTAWTGEIVAGLFCQAIGGWMLGRLLRRLNLGRVVALIVACLSAIAVWFILSWHIMPLSLDRHICVFFIGYPAYCVQVVMIGLLASAGVVGGARMGRRSQRVADSKRTGDDSPRRVVSSTYATFAVGQQEVHEVGMLSTGFGRTIYTIDHEKKLDVRSFSLRGSRSLTVGDDERHDVRIQWKALPFWSVQAFVDGQRHIDELYPDIRLLFRMMMTMLAVSVTLAVIMGLVLVLTTTSAM